MNFKAKFLEPHSIAQLFEASLAELTEWLVTDQLNAELKIYAQILKAYLQADVVTLKDSLNFLSPNSPAYAIGLLRLQNIENEYSESQAQACHDLACSDSEFAGEAAFALGMTYFRFKKNTEAKEIFKIAHKRLEQIGASKKAVKALMNVVVAESRIDNRKKLIYDYEFVAQKAKAASAIEVEGICYQNISKELHGVGAFDQALAYSHRAIELQKRDAGSLHFYESLLHRCHVLIDLGRFKEAHLDFQLAKVSAHPQIKAALRAIEKLLGADVSVQLDHLEPAWRSKLQVVDKPSMSDTEAVFVNLIKGRRLHRDVIVEQLYGSGIDWISAKNRFKVFMNRFKKKYPNVIAEEGGFYFLVDESVLFEK